MTGRPKRRAVEVELEIRTREMRFDGDLTATDLDYVVRWLESGKTLVELAKSITESSGVDVERESITGYLRRVHGDTARDRLAAARPEMTHAMVEQALDIADNVAADKDQIARAKLQMESRYWIAERLNQREFGSMKGTQLNINVQNLHLDALRSRAYISDGRDSKQVTAGNAIPDAIVEHVSIVSDEVATS